MGLAELIEEATREYDLVVLDAPPLLGFAEPLQMATAVDGVIVVARAGDTSRKALSSVITTLTRLRANLVGVVLNEVHREVSAGYYYYYGHYSKYYGRKRVSVAMFDTSTPELLVAQIIFGASAARIIGSPTVGRSRMAQSWETSMRRNPGLRRRVGSGWINVIKGIGIPLLLYWRFRESAVTSSRDARGEAMDRARGLRGCCRRLDALSSCCCEALSAAWSAFF